MPPKMLSLAISLFVVTGCSGVEPLGTGTLALDWEVSPSGCDDSGVEVVEVRAIGPHSHTERLACSRGGLELEVTAGEYTISLHGFDANGVETFTSQPTQFHVKADETPATQPIRLLASPSRVDVGWTFSNSKVCGANGVQWISVAAFDEYDYEVASAQFECDRGGGQVAALRAGAYLIEVSALDAERVRWRGAEPVKVGRGESVALDVELDPVE